MAQVPPTESQPQHNIETLEALDPRIYDRANLVSSQLDYRTLPNFPLFSRLLRHATRHPTAVAVRDTVARVEKSHLQLLTDVLSLRLAIEATLPLATLRKLQKDEDVYICILAPGGYEFAVAFVAILALGAAAVPLSTALPVEEAEYFVRKSEAVAILSATGSSDLAQNLHHALTSKNLQVNHIPIARSFQQESLPASEIVLSSARPMDPNGAGAIIFTSGTTGRPKAAVQRRTYASDVAQALADDFCITNADTLLHVLPVHHATGVGITFLPFLIAGACIEFHSGSFNPAWVWNRWKQGGSTFFSGVPTIYMRLKRYFEEHLMSNSGEYLHAARHIRMLCGTSALPQPLQDFWTGIRGGEPVLTRYGTTELQVVFSVRPEDRHIPTGSVGPATPGLDVKLTEEGEILVKSPFMFARYLNDADATTSAHDADGYFRTGDIARREGANYFILGRANIDTGGLTLWRHRLVIKSGGYKISALDIEREILALPYIAEAMVVGVPDEEFGQRVAAAVVVVPTPTSPSAPSLSIDSLRRDLRPRLVGYKMPTLLRVVADLPKNASGKVSKKVLGPRLFPAGGGPEVQRWFSGKM